jgi:hypothetical protein
VPQFGNDASSSSPSFSSTPTGFTRVTQTLRTDIVDLAIGFKGNVGPLTGYITFFVPLNTDGLRADWSPAGGLEVNF